MAEKTFVMTDEEKGSDSTCGKMGGNVPLFCLHCYVMVEITKKIRQGSAPEQLLEELCWAAANFIALSSGSKDNHDFLVKSFAKKLQIRVDATRESFQLADVSTDQPN